MNGIDFISNERKEQVDKHGYTPAHDDTYTNEELTRGAMFCLTLNGDYWPCDWDTKIRDKIRGKSDIERHAIAGAFCAAEIDRVVRAVARLTERRFSMKKTRVRAFSNGTEFMMWRDINCELCEKDCPVDDDGNHGDPLCDIETAIAIASIYDGKIDKSIADRANLPLRDGNIIEKCPEIVRPGS